MTKYENSNQSHFNKPQQPAYLIDGYPLIKQHRYGTSPFFIGKSSINCHFQVRKLLIDQTDPESMVISGS